MAKSTQLKQNVQEKALRKYFSGPGRSRITWGLIALAFASATLLGVLAAAMSGPGDDAAVTAAAGAAVAGLTGVFLLIRRGTRSALKDDVVDGWFKQGLEKIKAHSLVKLQLTPSDLVGDETLVVTAPILWTTPGIDDEDLVLRVGEDSFIRFGVYRITIIHLAQHHLDTYCCDYNFLKDAPLNEEAVEYPYRHVVSVAMRDYQSNYTLPSGQSFTYAQVFSLNVANGQSINVVIGADKLNEIKGTNSLPETGADKAIAAIRKMLREISAAESSLRVPPPSPMVMPVPPIAAPPPAAQPAGPIAPTMKMSSGQGLWLVDQRTGQRYALGQTTTIGRAPDNTVVLADPMVSGYHAVVQLEPAGYIVYDQNSANGTFADGHRLTGPHKLIPGRRLRLGNSEFLISAM